jgi:hypothetical protein
VSLAAELVVDTKRSHAHDLVAKCDHATTNPRVVFEDEHELAISVESGAGFVEAPVRLVPALSHPEACHKHRLLPT